MADLAEAEAMIRDLVAEQFGSDIDCTVTVDTDVDSDGDPILRVVIVADPITALRGNDMAGFVRHLRSRLATSRINDFPVVSYVSKAEAGKRRLVTH